MNVPILSLNFLPPKFQRVKKLSLFIFFTSQTLRRSDPSQVQTETRVSGADVSSKKEGKERTKERNKKRKEKGETKRDKKGKRGKRQK